jgi:hypothetical protein
MDAWIDRMIECLSPELASDLRVEEALATKYQNRPKGVFKYREDCPHSRENLENDCVWISSPTSYNDPYDSSIAITSSVLTNKTILEGVKAFIANELNSKLEAHDIELILSDPNPALMLGKVIMEKVEPVSSEQQTVMSGAFSEMLQGWEDAFKSKLPVAHKESLKVCSFSGTHDSIIMWSHYGDQHRGFCIEYDTESMSEGDLLMRLLYPVVYSKRLFDGTKYYDAALQNQQAFNILFPALAALYKSPEWSYEKEWRLVLPANMVKKASIWRVPTPKRIYLGSLMASDKREEIADICRRKKIEVHRMHLLDDSFALRSEKVQ